MLRINMKVVIEELFHIDGSLVLVGYIPDFDFEKRDEIYNMEYLTALPFQDKHYKILEVEIGRGGCFDTGSKKRMVSFRVEEVFV